MVCCNYRKRYQGAIAITTSLKHLQSIQKPINSSPNISKPEVETYSSEQTIIQQHAKSASQFSENTQIINNVENAPTTSDQTLIINNSEATTRTENTLIIKDNDVESTRIINPTAIRSNHKNSQQDGNKSRLKILIIGVVAVTIATIFLLLFSRKNQNYIPQESLVLPEYLAALS